MNNDEIRKKDWQLLNAHASIKTLALLQTVLENQAVIIAKLENLPVSEVNKKMNQYLKENTKTQLELIKERIPDYE